MNKFEDTFPFYFSFIILPRCMWKHDCGVDSGSIQCGNIALDYTSRNISVNPETKEIHDTCDLVIISDAYRLITSCVFTSAWHNHNDSAIFLD